MIRSEWKIIHDYLYDEGYELIINEMLDEFKTEYITKKFKKIKYFKNLPLNIQKDILSLLNESSFDDELFYGFLNKIYRNNISINIIEYIIIDSTEKNLNNIKLINLLVKSLDKQKHEKLYELIEKYNFLTI